MQYTKSNNPPQEQNVNITSSINLFFKRFAINKLLRNSRISKIRGVPVKDVLISIIVLPLIQKNFYQGIVKNKSLGFNKSVAYDFLKNSKYNWRNFLLQFVAKIINSHLKPLTSENRENVLIIDDTGYPRNRSKKVELLSRVFDHVKMCYFKGYRIMQLGWSDGNSFIPVDFALLASANKKNRYMEMSETINKRTCGYKRRKEATSKSTELIVPIIKRALANGIKAKYLLMDSWYGWPSIILKAKQYIDVICMVKNTPKIFYYLGNQSLTLDKVYKGFRKKRGKANIKGSQIVEIEHGGQRKKVKLVFVKNRNKKRSWLAILSTDFNLSDEEIVWIYGKRWDIEVFFKMTKHYLNLCNEIEIRSFDGMIAHITIVFLRYIFLAVEQRDNIDDKTFGGAFLELIEEMKDITIVDSLMRILSLAIETLREISSDTESFLEELIEIFVGLVLEKYGMRICLT